MDFELTEDQQRMRDVARDYARSVLAPEAARFDRDEDVPTSMFAGLAERGLMGVNVPAELGGTEAGVVAYSLAMTEIAAACASTAVTMAVTNMVGEVIARFGSQEQKRTYNPLLCGGHLGAFALSEVGAGSDPGSMQTTARRDGDGWVINGTKQWISHGDLSRVLVVWARTGDQGAKGISCFLVDGDTPGLEVARKEDKMGLRGSHTVGLAFDDMRVPASALLGREGDGFRIAMMALDGGRIGIASQALGLGEAAWERARSHVAADPALAREQRLQWPIADGRKDLDAARLLTLRAAMLKEQGKPFTREASMAKAFATETAWRVCSEAVRVMGSEGWKQHNEVERYLRDVRVTMIYEGTSEVQRLVIGRHLLR